MTLNGEQLSFQLDVPRSPLENRLEAGDLIHTFAGHATVTRIELIGQEMVVWADYGSGIEHPHSTEELITATSRTPPPRLGTVAGQCLEVHALGSCPGDSRTGADSLQSPEHLSPRPRRYSQRGQASGWIEERVGNRKRKTPTTSYYYCWQDSLTGRRTKRYIPAGKVWRIHQMLEQGRPIPEILEVLGNGR